jgi:hypothetical protein
VLAHWVECDCHGAMRIGVVVAMLFGVTAGDH